MFELKSISKTAVPAALEKAKHYRLLSEPAQAESICHDILAVEQGHPEATVTLILALSDQFHLRLNETFGAAKELAQGLGDYEKPYYLGLIYERRARSVLRRGGPGSGNIAYDWFRTALEHYQEAIDKRPEGNDDALLRWNSCVRTFEENPHVKPEHDTGFVPVLE